MPNGSAAPGKVLPLSCVPMNGFTSDSGDSGLAGALAGWLATSPQASPIEHAITRRPSLRLETARAGKARQPSGSNRRDVADRVARADRAGGDHEPPAARGGGE